MKIRAWKRLAVLFASMVLAASVAGQVPAPEEASLLNERERAAFDRIFVTTPDERSAVDALVAAAKARQAQAEREAEHIVNTYSSLPDDQKSPKARAEMIEKLRSVGPDDAALRAQLLKDLRAALTQGQQESWKKFEYFLRREEVLLASSGWGHDHTNLIALVELLDLSPSERSGASGVLDRYERDLDAALAALESAERALREALSKVRADGGDIDAARTALIKPERDAASALAQLNWQYVRRLCAALPEDKGQKLRALYDLVSLPEAFGKDSADLSIRSAPDLPGLDDTTRESLKQLAAEYSHRYDDLTRKIAAMEKVHRQTEGSDASVDMTQWDPLRIERRQVEADAQKKLKALVTEDQFWGLLKDAQRSVDAEAAKMVR